MSFLYRIPPMVSALAFGYGVGMVAPDATMTGLQNAVSPQRTTSVAAAPPAVMVAPPPMGELQADLGIGPESRELGRLRATMLTSDRRDPYGRDRPMMSMPPRYESVQDREVEDPDDLGPAGVEALSRLQLPDLKISVSRRTLEYVRFFAKSDRGRGMFTAWLKRSGRYQDLILTELRSRRLPEDLIWLSMIESGFDPRIKSPAGAVGLWQFMPATGKVYGLQQGSALDQRRNPRLATQAAAHHLRDLYQRFGEWDLAMAAYNMGYEQLLDRIDRYGTADFNELARQGALPKETASYVPKIVAAAIVANNLDRFGFGDVKIEAPVDGAEIAVPPGTPLKLLAKAAGVSTATIRKMNPDMLGERVPPGLGDYMLNVPAEALSRAQVTLPAFLRSESMATQDSPVVDPLDLLGGRDFKAPRDNDESLLSLLPPPKRRSTMRSPAGEESNEEAGDKEARVSASEEPSLRDAAAPKAKAAGKQTLYYRVGAGDTLSEIAQQFGVSVSEVKRDNRLETGKPLRIGALLKLQVRQDSLGAIGEGSTAGEVPSATTRRPEKKG